VVCFFAWLDKRELNMDGVMLVFPWMEGTYRSVDFDTFLRVVVLLVGWLLEGKPFVFSEVSCMTVLATVILGFQSLITDLCF
jgi:hypothetical protein